MFDAICALIPRDPDYPPRVATLDVLRRVLAGTIYNVLPYQFHEERGAGGEYIPIRQRRPSIRYALCRTVVEDSVALLFSEGHFPTIVCTDLELRGFLADLVRDAGLNAVMIDAALRGSVGSVALLLRILKGRVYVSVVDSLFLTPVWRADAPDTLAVVTEQYKVRGAQLAAQGYEIAEPSIDYRAATAEPVSRARCRLDANAGLEPAEPSPGHVLRQCEPRLPALLERHRAHLPLDHG
jgi:hypothetical protein